MDKTTIFILIGIAAVIFIVFLIWKNQKDKKLINPDAQDAVQETISDQERERTKV